MTQYVFVPKLEDLIHPHEYADDPEGRRLRVRITMGAEGLVLEGDAARVAALEELLGVLGVAVVEQMLCG